MHRLLGIATSALLLNACAVADAYKSALLPGDDSVVIAACLKQGTYMDTRTHACAPFPPPPVPTPQQRQAQADFDARVEEKAAQCTTGSKQMCRVWATQQVIDLEGFCLGKYKSAAYVVPAYKALGWPVEMTVQQMAPDVGVPLDILVRLVRAGYTGRWKTNSDFADEAAQRCLSENPF